MSLSESSPLFFLGNLTFAINFLYLDVFHANAISLKCSLKWHMLIHCGYRMPKVGLWMPYRLFSEHGNYSTVLVSVLDFEMALPRSLSGYGDCSLLGLAFRLALILSKIGTEFCEHEAVMKLAYIFFFFPTVAIFYQYDFTTSLLLIILHINQRLFLYRCIES